MAKHTSTPGILSGGRKALNVHLSGFPRTYPRMVANPETGHKYRGERCIFCGVNIYDEAIYYQGQKCWGV